MGPKSHHFLVAIGTVLRMLRVVLLRHTRFNAQTLIPASYMLLSRAYRLPSMIPKNSSGTRVPIPV